MGKCISEEFLHTKGPRPEMLHFINPRQHIFLTVLKMYLLQFVLQNSGKYLQRQ